jgi:hypothetical protein
MPLLATRDGGRADRAPCLATYFGMVSSIIVQSALAMLASRALRLATVHWPREFGRIPPIPNIPIPPHTGTLHTHLE